MNTKSKTPDEIDYRAEQDKMEAVLKSAIAQLREIPGVVEVGIGLRKRDDALTSELVWRVHVDLKKPREELAATEVVPTMVEGFPTDIITNPEYQISAGFDDENDMSNYSRKIGGITINRKDHSFAGTLGCMVRMADNKVGILTNYHVLWEPGDAPSAGVGVGQPEHSSSICCTCNEFATTIMPPATSGRHSDGKFDCSIAVLKSGVKYSAKIKPIKRNDGTVEVDGIINGSENPTVNDIVWKVGRTSGLTRGRIDAIVNNVVAIVPLAPFAKWSDEGDSGSSVIKTSTGNVVALHWGRPASPIQNGAALPIQSALTTLNVTIIASTAGDGTQSGLFELEGDPILADDPSSILAKLVDRVETRPQNGKLVRSIRHCQSEISQLVNTCRPVTVAWQRNAGPAWMAAVMRSAREPLYRLPAELNGVPRGQ